MADGVLLLARTEAEPTPAPTPAPTPSGPTPPPPTPAPTPAPTLPPVAPVTGEKIFVPYAISAINNIDLVDKACAQNAGNTTTAQIRGSGLFLGV